MNMNEIKFQEVIKLLREQLNWEIKKEDAMYKHVKEIFSEYDTNEMKVESFVRQYRLIFKPGYPEHPTGGVEGIFLIINKED